MDPTGNTELEEQMLYCGESSIPWADFVACSKHPSLKPGLVGTAAFVFLEDDEGSKLISGPNDGPPLYTLQELIQKYGMSQAADLRDRVYSLLSLASDCKDNPQAPTPDYAMSTFELGQTVLRFCRPKYILHFSKQLRKVLQTTTSANLIQSAVRDAQSLAVYSMRREFKETGIFCFHPQYLTTIKDIEMEARSEEDCDYFKLGWSKATLDT